MVRPSDNSPPTSIRRDPLEQRGSQHGAASCFLVGAMGTPGARFPHRDPLNPCLAARIRWNFSAAREEAGRGNCYLKRAHARPDVLEDGGGR
eukprot:1068741-Alexandrium_andersonii.AAC.1